MNYRHGMLESIILNALWELEKSGAFKHSIKDVFDYINAKSPTKRAYTTIKTVMDRLFEKELLLRVKSGKKFYYRSAYSKEDIVKKSLEIIAKQYCNSDFNELANYADSFRVKDLVLI